MNIRQFLGIGDDYASFNREERHLAAIFFHALHLGDNLSRFLRAAGSEQTVAAGHDVSVAFEFAYLRDAWWGIDDNATKRRLIETFLEPARSAALRETDVLAFNSYFGAGPKPSRLHIQSPSNWSVGRFDPHIASDDDFLEVCRFKWAFNAKPDLVIQTANDRCICIEAKLESGEGRYPSSQSEKQIFKRRGLDYVTQTDLQRYMLEELLGFETEFLFLASRPPAAASSHRFISWSDAFDAMSASELPAHMRATIAAMTGSSRV